MRSRSRFLFLYFAAWIPVAAIYTLLIYLSSSDRTASGAMAGGGQSALFAALLGLPVWSMSRRLAERPRSTARVIGTHVLFAIAYSVVWTGLMVLSIALFAPPFVLQAFVQFAVGWELLTGVLFYGIIAGIAHAVAVGARLRREREAAVRAEALRARAELSALRAQMNPHFLFNTLHSIAALARTDPKAVQDALERLALLLRRLLDVNRSGVDRIMLAEEWEIVRDQLELEHLRFGERLHIVTDIDGDALECRIPVFTLQPLVENAVRHGVALQTRPTTLSIAARVVGDELVIQVSDDGPGAELRGVSAAPGLGLRAIRERLLAHYGDRASVRVETSPGSGFSVRVVFPAEAVPAVATGERPIAGATVVV